MSPRRTRASDSTDESERTLQRRAALRKTAALLGGLASATLLPAAAAENTPHRSGAAGDPRRGSVIAADGAPIADTGSGKVVGYVRNGIQTFKGIPYGENTEGANRFMPPVKVKAWSGVRSSRQYGNVAPQAPREGWANDEEAFMFSWDDGVQGEDCLRINVWTPSVKGKQRPVMVWLHGGGFSAGSGQELRAYDGENLARRGEVVVVSLNHRLNVLGYLNLAQYGDRYASSANLGMLDIVAALEWVRDNIEGFGGDPGAVTVFGQSGGGGKVGALMGMPAASGLFHRAIVESGSMLRLGSEDKSRQLAELIVAELGLSRTTIHEIQTLPCEKLIQASTKVLREHASIPKGTLPNFRRIADSLGFAPIVDGSILPAHPFDPRASALSADVPMIIGSTLNEFITAMNHPEVERMTETELEQRVRGVYGDRTPRVIEAFKQRSPYASPFDLWSHIGAAGIRQAAIAQATAKATLGNAPAYLYWFAWQTPILNGRPRAFHCAEIPFVFDNTDRCENMTGGGPDARALAAIMSDAWIQFARTGNPNHPRMPRWDAFSPDRKQTMIFDNKSVQVDGPDAAEQDSTAEA
jgi:para-nitrobenzyl esterase